MPDHRVFSRELLHRWDVGEVGRPEPRLVSGDESKFAIFAFYAVTLESLDEVQREELLLTIKDLKCPSVDCALFASRFDKAAGPVNCDLATPYRELVESWVRQQTSFVRLNSGGGEGSEQESDQFDFDVSSAAQSAQ
jgi:hypothetical protein